MSVFIIRNKNTLEQWVASSGKRSWNKSNHAKAAFANSLGKTKRDPLLREFVTKLSKYESLKFNNQDVYEVVELHSDAEKRAARNERILKEINKLLKESKVLPEYITTDGEFITCGHVGTHLECIELIAKIKEKVNDETIY